MNKPLDFQRVEAIRKHMLLSQSDMAHLLSVSRMTYYSWVGGKSLRKVNDEKVRSLLKKLLLAATKGWPMPEVRAMGAADRLRKLEEVLEQSSKQ